MVNTNIGTFDKHDKVNYAVTDAKLIINQEQRKITLDIQIDTELCPVLDYFEIFMQQSILKYGLSL